MRNIYDTRNLNTQVWTEPSGAILKESFRQDFVTRSESIRGEEGGLAFEKVTAEPGVAIPRMLVRGKNSKSATTGGIQRQGKRHGSASN